MADDCASRRRFLRRSAVLVGGASFMSSGMKVVAAAAPVPTWSHSTPSTLVADSRVKLSFGEEKLVLPDGLQPSMLCTRKGTFIVQAQNSQKAGPHKRMFYPYALSTVVSRDGGNTWNPVDTPDANNLNLEGAIFELKNGTILALDTYVVPADKPDMGTGMLYTSKDEYRTLQGPVDVHFQIPNVDFFGSTDDGGRPYGAARLHRRILEMPNGDLLTLIYGLLKGDTTPCPYQPKMKKSRVMLFRSEDKGMNWNFVSTVAVDPSVGTEGFGEPAFVRVSQGKHAGRLVCLMRTGQHLYQCSSDNSGLTWSKPQPREFAGRDVLKTSEWATMFKDVRRNRKPLADDPAEFNGSVVDPDVIELRGGLLVATFGVRIPAHACFAHPEHPWNGNYLACSLDGGDTWSHIVQLTSGTPTTQYTAVEKMPGSDEFFVVCDYGYWRSEPGKGRYVYGRKITLNLPHGL